MTTFFNALEGLSEVTNLSKLFPSACAILWLAMRRGDEPNSRAVAFLDSFIAEMDELQRLAAYAEIKGELAWLGKGDRDLAIAILKRVVDRAGETPETVPLVLLWLDRLGGDFDLNSLDRILPPVRFAIAGKCSALAEGDADARDRSVALLREMGAEAVLRCLDAYYRERGLESTYTPPRKAQQDHPSGLTRHQLEVLAVLNEGYSNAEIGERLFISAKTVDHHVSAILAQIGVGSRGEAAAVARGRGWI